METKPKTLLVPNWAFFIFFIFFILVIIVGFSRGIQEYGPGFFVAPFISFILFFSIVMIGIYGASILLKFEYKLSNSPMLKRNWKNLFPNNWEAFKSNSIILSFVFFVTTMFALAFMKQKSKFLLTMAGGLSVAFLPPIVLIYLMKKAKKEFLQLGKMKIAPQVIFWGWVLFIILMLRLLSAMRRPENIVFGIFIALLPFIVLVFMTMRKK